MDRQIFLPTEVKKEMIKTFKTNKVTLWSALNFDTNSSFAKLLRAAAIERGGVLYTGRKRPEYSPECITTFETADKTMTQVFSNRVYLVADLSTGGVNVYADGNLTDSYKDVTLLQLSSIQMDAEALSNQLKK